jgi:hypothetical protein
MEAGNGLTGHTRIILHFGGSMSKEIARYIGGEETMAGAWARLDIFHSNPLVYPGPEAGNPSIS